MMSPTPLAGEDSKESIKPENGRVLESACRLACQDILKKALLALGS